VELVIVVDLSRKDGTVKSVNEKSVLKFLMIDPQLDILSNVVSVIVIKDDHSFISINELNS
jgi:hypothetical protein